MTPGYPDERSSLGSKAKTTKCCFCRSETAQSKELKERVYRATSNDYATVAARSDNPEVVANKTIEYRFRSAIPHKARSFQGESKRSVEPQKTPMRLGRAMKNPTSATKKGL